MLVKRGEHAIWNFTLAFLRDGIWHSASVKREAKEFHFHFFHSPTFVLSREAPADRTTHRLGRQQGKRWKFSFLASSVYIYLFLSPLGLPCALAAMKIFLFPARCTYFSDTHTATREAVRPVAETLFNREGRANVHCFGFNKLAFSLNFPFYGGWKERREK